jgi:FkbM family methyltransferase
VKSIIHTVRFIAGHPLNKGTKFVAVMRFIRWQISYRIFKAPIICDFGEQSKLIIVPGMTGATQNMYCGLQEFNDMGFLLHFLREEDHFIDVGANIGSYTVLAAKEIGSVVSSFEPVPSTFKSLNDNIRINYIETLVTTYNIALGDANSLIAFTENKDTTNHAVLEKAADTIQVPIKKLDDILKVTQKCLLKIDVEGFESRVIKGMGSLLKNNYLVAIIIELNGLGSRYGYKDLEIHQEIVAAGFYAYQYDPFERTLVQLQKPGNANTLYIRDLGFVKERLETAKVFEILGKNF